MGVEIRLPAGCCSSCPSVIDIYGPYFGASLKVGDRVSAVIHPLRDGLPGGSFVSVTLADGTVLGANKSGESGSPKIPEPWEQRDR